MKYENKAIIILNEEECCTFEKFSDIIHEICAKRSENKEYNCEKCPCFLICNEDDFLDSISEFFDCDIETE